MHSNYEAAIKLIDSMVNDDIGSLSITEQDDFAYVARQWANHLDEVKAAWQEANLAHETMEPCDENENGDEDDYRPGDITYDDELIPDGYVLEDIK